MLLLRYDWVDDGADPSSKEQNFGTNYIQYYNESVPYIPKLSYHTAVTLTQLVPPENYIGQIVKTESPNDPSSVRYVLEFAASQKHSVTSSSKLSTKDSAITSSSSSSIYAVWAVGGQPQQCSAVHTRNRKECGYPGIPKDFCTSNGCCYDVSIDEVIYFLMYQWCSVLFVFLSYLECRNLNI